MKIFTYLTITACLFMLVIGSTERDTQCDENPDYMYWPMSVDSTQVYLNNIKDYHKKVDKIEEDILGVKKHIDKHEWRKFHTLHMKYRKLEQISVNNHPKNEKYYGDMQKIYLDVSNAIRKLNLQERVIKDRHNIKE